MQILSLNLSLQIIEVTKVLTKIAKVSGCESLGEWIKPCTNHLYWSARTTQDGNREVIWAKFSSFLSHVINKHENLDNPVFNKCAHDEQIQPRKWLDKGMKFNTGLILPSMYLIFILVYMVHSTNICSNIQGFWQFSHCFARSV